MKMCVTCNKKPPEKGKTRCAECLEKQRTSWRKRYHTDKARKEAFGKKDVAVPIRTYHRRPKTPAAIMQAMIGELELFIRRMPQMTAEEYLTSREQLINTIITRGKQYGN